MPGLLDYGHVLHHFLDVAVRQLDYNDSARFVCDEATLVVLDLVSTLSKATFTDLDLAVASSKPTAIWDHFYWPTHITAIYQSVSLSTNATRT